MGTSFSNQVCPPLPHLQIRLPFFLQPDISAVVITASGIFLFILDTVSKELGSNLKRTVNLGYKNWYI